MDKNKRARILRGAIFAAILSALVSGGSMWWSMTTESTIFLPMLGGDGKPMNLGSGVLAGDNPGLDTDPEGQ